MAVGNRTTPSTIGTDPELDRVCEFGVVRFVGGDVESSECIRLNPGIPIPAAASKVHHITDDMVVGAPCFADAAHRIVSHLSRPRGWMFADGSRQTYRHTVDRLEGQSSCGPSNRDNRNPCRSAGRD